MMSHSHIPVDDVVDELEDLTVSQTVSLAVATGSDGTGQDSAGRTMMPHHDVSHSPIEDDVEELEDLAVSQTASLPVATGSAWTGQNRSGQDSAGRTMMPHHVSHSHIGGVDELEDLAVKRARWTDEETDGWTGVNERTFIAVKPDGVQRRLVGEIIRRFEKKGFKLVGLKLQQASEDLLREHYWELRGKPFFSGLIRYMSSGPVVAMVWQGLDVVKTARKMLGETNPRDSLPGTIRGDYGVEVGRNVVHGSDSVGNAQREIALWFSLNQLHCWEDSSSHWIYV